MAEFSGFRFSEFDESVEGAWREFRGALADRLAAMRAGDTLELHSPDHRPAEPCVRYRAWTSEHVRAEVPAGELSADDRSALVERGWFVPTCGPEDDPGGGSCAFFVDLPTRRADQLAQMAVDALRRVWGVPHPAFVRPLSADGPVALATAAEPVPALAAGPDLNTAIAPRDREHLVEVVGEVLTAALNGPPQVDRDGDFELGIHGHTVYVIVMPRSPIIRIWVPLLHSITGRTRAAELLTDLTPRWPHLRLSLLQDRLYAEIDVVGDPFVPGHLIDLMVHMSHFLADVDDTFADRFDGRLYGVDDDTKTTTFMPAEPDGRPAPEEGGDDLPPALLTLLQLDTDGPLSGEEVAAVCDHDRDAILEYLRLSEEQVIAWRTSAKEAAASSDPDEADACEHESRSWQETVGSLRAALRFVTIPPGHERRAVPEQDALFDAPTEPSLFDEPG